MQVRGLVLHAEGEQLGDVHGIPLGRLDTLGKRLHIRPTTRLQTSLQSVRARIAQACAAAGRAPDSVALLAVSKTFGADAVHAAALAGQCCFGENYIQEAVEKSPRWPRWPAPALEWHCIGPVQQQDTPGG